MNSNNSVSAYNDDSFFGTVLVYFFIAALFFFIGRNFDRIRTEVKQRTTEKRGSKVSAA